MVDIPSDEHVGAVVEIVGCDGTGNTAKFVNDAEATEVQLPLPAVTVYPVPTVMPEINPPTPTVGPAGVKV